MARPHVFQKIGALENQDAFHRGQRGPPPFSKTAGADWFGGSPLSNSAASSPRTSGSSPPPVAKKPGSKVGAWREARTAQARSHASSERHAIRIDSASGSLPSAVAFRPFAGASSKTLVTCRKIAWGNTCPRYSNAGASSPISRDLSRSNAPERGLGSYQQASAPRARLSAISADSRNVSASSRTSGAGSPLSLSDGLRNPRYSLSSRRNILCAAERGS